MNSQLIEFLDEWRQDAPSRYRKAKDDICYWITDEWYSFESPMQKEIESAYQTALKKKDDMAIALALSPFAMKTAELVKDDAYEMLPTILMASHLKTEKDTPKLAAISLVAAGFGGDMDEELCNELTTLTFVTIRQSLS